MEVQKKKDNKNETQTNLVNDINKIRKIFYAVFFSLLVLLPVNNIYAEQKTGLVIEPASKILAIAPGDKLDINFNLTNNNEFDVTFSLKAGEIKDGKVVIDDSKEAVASKWITFGSTGVIVIKSKETYPVELVLNIPATAIEGIYTIYAVAEVTTPTSDTQSNASIKEYLPFQIIADVNSKSKFNSDTKVKSLSVNKNPVFDNNFKINLGIENFTNNTFSKPIAYFQIINPRGEVVKQEVINDTLNELAGGETINREFEYSFNILDFRNLGQYRTELLVVDTLSQKSNIQKVSFLVLPLPYMILLALLIIIFGVLIAKKKIKRKS